MLENMKIKLATPWITESDYVYKALNKYTGMEKSSL